MADIYRGGGHEMDPPAKGIEALTYEVRQTTNIQYTTQFT